MDKATALQDVLDAADNYRHSQQQATSARERFIDSIVEARKVKATQQEIAERCLIEPGSADHLSRQRVAQFIKERV